MRAKLGALVRAASSGEAIVVDVRGRPAAKLVPFNDDAGDAVSWFKSHAQGPQWNVSGRELIEDGRR